MAVACGRLQEAAGCGTVAAARVSSRPVSTCSQEQRRYFGCYYYIVVIALNVVISS